ncbi:S-layer homology domain-containing protein [Paenibacillus sp. NPDC056579]|uniref:S-layer homology domain-containing protein n=1 Tax=Paenibacillus sp. NPDC056579 TaxID=3345871 RepID=UPI0036ACD640
MKRATLFVVIMSLLWGLITPALAANGTAASADTMPRSIQDGMEGVGRTVTRQVAQLSTDGAAVSQSVYNPKQLAAPVLSLDPPVLEPLPELTKQPFVEVKGSAKLNAAVTVQLSFNGGPYFDAGSTVVTGVYGAATGPFTVPVSLASEGTYSIAATAKLDGVSSDKSNIMRVEVDRTAPAYPYELSWTNPSYDRIELEWKPPTVLNPDGSGTYIPDPDLDHYLVVKDGKSVKETKLPYHLETDVPEMTYVDYEIYSVDKAGNQSEGYYHQLTASFQKNTSLIASSTDTAEGREWFWDSVISRDGLSAAFRSAKRDLETPGSPPPDAADYSLYFHRMDTGKTIRIGDAPDMYDAYGVINLSADGRYAVYSSRRDDSGNSELVLYDTASRIRVPLVHMNGSANEIALSDDANWVAFSSDSADIVSGDTNGQSDVFVYNRATKETKRISAGPGEQQANAASGQPALSGDGKYVAFTSDATNLIPGGHDRTLSRLFLYNIETGVLEHIPVVDGDNTERRAWLPNLSRDGSLLAYTANYESEESRVTVLDRRSGTHRIAADFPSSLSISLEKPRLSADGRYVVVDYNNYDPFGSSSSPPFNSHAGVVRIDLKTGEFKPIGNRARKSASSDIGANGNQALYIQDGAAVYSVCFESCGQTAPGGDIQKAAWHTEQTVHGQPFPGSDIMLYAYGTAGQQLRAVVGYKDRSGGAQTATVDLTADTGSGTVYSGSFVIPAEATELTSVRAVSKTDPSVYKDAASLPVPVAGKLNVKVQARPEYEPFLRGANIVLWSEAARQGNSVKLKDGMDVGIGLGAASDYTLRVIDTKGNLLLQQNGIVIERGKESALTVDALPSAELAVTVKSEDDGAVIGQAKVQLLDRNGSILSAVQTNFNGEAKFTGSFLTGDEVKLRVTAYSPYLNPPEAALQLQPGLNTKPFSLEKETFGNVEGTVTDPDGKPVAGVRVALTEPMGGRRVKDTVTDGQGRYSLRTNASTYWLQAEKILPPLLSTEKPVTVKMLPGQTVTADLQVIPQGPGRIELVTLMKPVDGDWQKIEMPDWRSAVHYGLTVKGGSPSFRYNTNGVTDNLLPVVGAPGEQVTVCMDGTEAGLQSACTEVTLDEYRSGTAELRLEEKGRITGRIAGETNYSGFYAYANTINGQRVGYFRGSTVDSSGRFSISLPQSGKVELLINLETWPTNRGRSSYSKFVDVAEGQLLDLGDILMPSGELFYGKPDNGLNVLEMTAVPGSTVTLRGSYKLPYTNRVSLAGGYLGIEVPAGTELVPGSVMLKGVPVEPVPGSEGSGTWKVPIGTITARELVAFSYRLKLDPNASNDVMARVHIGYDDAQGTKEELLGISWIRLEQLTLEAPKRTTEHTIKVSGRAPAGQTVSVYADDQLVGQTQSTPGGLWYSSVTLPPKPEKGVWSKGSSTYVLRAQAQAEAGTAGNTAPSKTAAVTVDSGYTAIKNIVMRQPEGSRVSINPAEGVARFPFVIVPSMPIFFELESNAPELITNVKVRLGDVEIPAFYNKEDGKFHAMMQPVSYMGSGLYVTYDEKPKAFEKGPVPTEEDWKAEQARMTDVWRNATYELLDEQSGEQPFTDEVTPADDGFVHSPTLKIKYNMDGKEELGYFRLSAKAASGNFGGGKKYRDVKTRVNEEAGIIEMEATIDASLLMGDAAAPIRALLGPAAAAEAGGITVKSTFRVGGALFNLSKYVTDGLDFAEYADQLIEFQDYVIATECHSPTVNHYLRQTERLFNQAKRNLIVKNATTGLALVAGTLTLVIPPVGGVIIGGVLGVMGYIAKSSWQDELDKLKADFEKEKQWRDDMAEAGAIDRCDKKDDDDDDDNDDHDDNRPDDDDKVADPAWIYDPSGYVYETLPENRLEGVTATILKKNEENGAWELWDSDWYGQSNPLVTDGQGKYGWDVPEGKWQVLYEKDGYLPARSPELTVLPPHLDVNIPMKSLEPPRVTVADAVYGTGVRVRFSKYMLADSLTIIVETTDGERIEGTVEPAGAVKDAENQLVSRQFRWIPSGVVTAGKEYKVTVAGWVNSYAKVSMEQDYSATVTMKPSGTPPAEAAEQLKTTAGRKQLGVHWKGMESLDAGKLKLYWRVKGSSAAYAGPVELDSGQNEYLLGGLLPGTTYELKLAAASADGTAESAGITAEGTTIQEDPLIVDTTPAAEVAQAAIQPGTSALTVSWTDPGDADLRNVLVSWKKRTDARFGKPVDVDPGVGTLRIDGLESSTEYQVRIMTSDRISNLSQGITLDARTKGTEPEPDRTPPQEVSSLSVNYATSEGFTVKWTDPADADLKEIRISVKKQGEGEAFGTDIAIPKGTSQYSFTGLQADTGYQVRLVTADLSGNVSAGVTVDARTAAKSRGRGGGGGGGTTVPPVEQPAANVVELSPKAGEWSGYEQRIRFRYEEGTFPAGSRMNVHKVETGPVPAGYEAYSEAFRLQLESGTMGKPLQLSLHYDPVKHADFDVRKLGIYRKDESGISGGWTYIGGIANSAEGMITARVAQPGTYAVMAYGRPFADLREHWSRRDVQVLISRHLIDGMTEQTFEPEQPMTRAQFTKLLVEMTASREAVAGNGTGVKLAPLTEAPFSDVDAQAWYAPYIAWAKQKGLVEGSDGLFRPDDVLTRQELAALIVRALGLEAQAQSEAKELAEAGAVPGFADGAAIATWAAGYVETARKQGLMDGVDEGRFAPELTASRAQGAVLILRAMERLGLVGK